MQGKATEKNITSVVFQEHCPKFDAFQYLKLCFKKSFDLWDQTTFRCMMQSKCEPNHTIGSRWAREMNLRMRSEG